MWFFGFSVIHPACEKLITQFLQRPLKLSNNKNFPQKGQIKDVLKYEKWPFWAKNRFFENESIIESFSTTETIENHIKLNSYIASSRLVYRLWGYICKIVFY